MTAILTSEEAARLTLGVNVIVRPGIPCLRTMGDYHAPQDWVALTGPCPTCDKRAEELHDAYEAAAAVEGWATQERSRKPWSDVPEANKRTMRTAIRQVFCCPDCRDGRRIVPLHRICPTCAADPHPCWKCKSIEVVPVVMVVLGPRPYSVFQRDDRALVFRGAHPDEVTNRFLGYWPNDKPPPDPGRDFGIVIDCVELA